MRERTRKLALKAKLMIAVGGCPMAEAKSENDRYLCAKCTFKLLRPGENDGWARTWTLNDMWLCERLILEQMGPDRKRKGE